MPARYRHSPDEPTRMPWRPMAVVFIGVIIAIGLIVAIQLRVFGVKQWWLVFRLAVVDWSPWLFLAPLVLWLSVRVVIDAHAWRRAMLIHLVASLGIAVCDGVAVAALDAVILPESYQLQVVPPTGTHSPEAPTANPDRPARQDVNLRARRNLIAFRVRMAVPIYWLLVGGIHAWIFQRRSVARERRALRAEAELAEAKLAALQAQLQPHFLFNSLNTISSLLYENPRLADEMLCQLSTLLRRVLDRSALRSVTLRDELATTECYLAIQVMRFGDRLSVQRDLDPAALEGVVPPFLLQPLFENMFVHGFANSERSHVIRISAQRRSERLVIELEDDGLGAPASVTERLGLGHTRARLAALYPGQYLFERGPQPGGGFRVHLELPYQEPTDNPA